jgi:hypothetical protein
MKKLFCVLTLLLALAAGAHAQAPAKDSEGFEAVDGSMMAKSGESIPASKLVAAAYGFIFCALLVYVGSVALRVRQVEEELDQIKRKLDKQA